jgi:RNA polymerase sigma-70 factor (ECF subfamily)
LKQHTDKGQSDTSLILAAQQGDRRAFAALVRRYESTVYRFAFKVCRDPAQAEEALQDTFINVYRKLRSFDGRSKFSTWLYTIVTNNCLMKRRKQRSEVHVESLEALDGPPTGENERAMRTIARWDVTPSDILLDRELRDVVEKAIEKLPMKYRLVFTLRDMEGRSNGETAAILKISGEAAKTRLRRARSFLRTQLDSYVNTREGRR